MIHRCLLSRLVSTRSKNLAIHVRRSLRKARFLRCAILEPTAGTTARLDAPSLGSFARNRGLRHLGRLKGAKAVQRLRDRRSARRISPSSGLESGHRMDPRAADLSLDSRSARRPRRLPPLDHRLSALRPPSAARHPPPDPHRHAFGGAKSSNWTAPTTSITGRFCTPSRSATGS